MKKIKSILLLTIFLATSVSAYAVNIGTYKSDTEYGLIDGFKFNVFGRRDGEKMIQLKSETQEEKDRLEREKDKPPEKQDEYQLFKFIQENTVPF